MGEGCWKQQTTHGDVYTYRVAAENVELHTAIAAVIQAHAGSLELKYYRLPTYRKQKPSPGEKSTFPVLPGNQKYFHLGLEKKNNARHPRPIRRQSVAITCHILPRKPITVETRTERVTIHVQKMLGSSMLQDGARATPGYDVMKCHVGYRWLSLHQKSFRRLYPSPPHRSDW